MTRYQLVNRVTQWRCPSPESDILWQIWHVFLYVLYMAITVAVHVILTVKLLAKYWPTYGGHQWMCAGNCGKNAS